MSGRPNFHEKELNQLGLIESIDMTGPARRWNYTVLCGCGAHTTFGTPNGMPGRVIAKRIERQDGWRSKPPKWKCPTCLNPPKRPDLRIVSPAPVIAVVSTPAKPEPFKEPAPMPAIADALPQPKMSEVRAVIGLLEQHFDAKTGTYTLGWSDRRVSEVANVPMIQVANIREEGFGPLKADPVMVGLREDQSKIMKKIDSLLTDCIALGNRIESYAAKQGVK